MSPRRTASNITIRKTVTLLSIRFLRYQGPTTRERPIRKIGSNDLTGNAGHHCNRFHVTSKRVAISCSCIRNSGIGEWLPEESGLSPAGSVVEHVFLQLDGSRADENHENAWENEKNERKYHFHCRLCSFLFRHLATFHSHRIRLHTECLCD